MHGTALSIAKADVQTKENIGNKVCLSITKRYNIKPFLRFSL
ncbi:hypothetical protein FLJC2902T_13510 [Flavobacterium limnosediminis JC2902]|uniref:Uncharacterized protein n=1 Tax=Flavobacterium limnosediminis JC2902 TaxID=1341181 RepID=V6SQ60_9FLAO|nr:hypothetical protein FLJC2902T_13510 [Flavobacterium limnosediminis JC2902]